LGEDIVTSFEIVTDSWIENGFTVDGLISKAGAPRLKKVNTDSSSKYGTFVGAIKIFK
jgi:hypothetical protein